MGPMGYPGPIYRVLSIWRGPRVDFIKNIVKTKVVELDEPINSKPVAPSDLFSNGGS